jgi:hypothetical protein
VVVVMVVQKRVVGVGVKTRVVMVVVVQQCVLTQ